MIDNIQISSSCWLVTINIAHEYTCRREALMFYIVTMPMDMTMKIFKDVVTGCFRSKLIITLTTCACEVIYTSERLLCL